MLSGVESRERLLFADDFDGPAGSPPDYARWSVAPTSDQIRDGRRNVFLDGNSNLVIRAAREGDKYVGGTLMSNWQAHRGTTWEARVRLQPLDVACWPAAVLGVGAARSAVAGAGWRGHVQWAPSAPAGSGSHPVDVDDQWHTWRCAWHDRGMSFWTDYVKGAAPSFDVPARAIPDASVLPALKLAAPGSGGTYPAQMLVDWVRVW